MDGLLIDLASPMDSENFDKEHFKLVENDIKHLFKTFTENKIENISPVHEVEFSCFLASMKKKEAKEKSSLKYINFNDSNIGTVHNIWKSSGTDPYSINMAAIKVKIATGIMILQYQRSRFSKNCISAICPLCNIEPEDMTHFILKCEKLSSIRNRFMQELKSLLVDCNKPPLLIQELFDDKENLLHLIIDCTSYHFLTYKEQVRIETLTRGLCYKLYHKRLLLMSE
ncbi:unnamed protein product [Mytilus edulis]|uniref:Reverse transcriptase zinc-binding domain-containing protein n=1 Tax=Mytilus edulis TaxID=6550 RepID=A0A8S3REQ5_MYTED|nr:unnamed protein product [Mytilus edulis]